MTKLQRLKFELIKYNRTKSLAVSHDICEWLYKELVKKPKEIEIKEG